MAATFDQRTIGLIVNPIAGMGGKVGLRGTDGRNRLRRAREMGAMPAAPQRTGLALDRLAAADGRFKVLTAPGDMGEDIVRYRDFDARTVGKAVRAGDSTAADTHDAAVAMADAGAELILFAGGDGTARVLRESIGRHLPVIGIPTGVKMHSGCFARNPSTAGDVAADFLKTPRGLAVLEDVDVVDRVKSTYGAAPDQVLFGSLSVPLASNRLLGPKSQSASRDGASLTGACHEIVEQMDPRNLYILGPGSTTGRIRQQLGFELDPLAVDVVKANRPYATDVTETELIHLVAGPEPVEVILGVIGGQGSLLGRGNQQISARVLRHLGPKNLTIVASLGKLIGLGTSPLSIDTGDPAIDNRLAGHRPVRTGRQETLICEVKA